MSVVNDIWTKLGTLIPNLNISASSITRKIVEACGSVIDTVLLEILRTEQSISSMLQSMRIVSPAWYLEKVYAYQAGDNLTIINPATQELGYAIIDPSKQIIKQAAIATDSLGGITINVATANNENNIVRLTIAELNAFNTYIQNFVPLGAQIISASNAPAVWTATKLYVRYQRIYNLDDIKASLNTALHNIQLIQRVVNRVYINDVEATIMTMPGIRDAYFVSPSLIEDGKGQMPIDGTFTLGVGYFNFDPRFYTYGPTQLTVFEPVD